MLCNGKMAEEGRGGGKEREKKKKKSERTRAEGRAVLLQSREGPGTGGWRRADWRRGAGAARPTFPPSATAIGDAGAGLPGAGAGWGEPLPAAPLTPDLPQGLAFVFSEGWVVWGFVFLGAGGRVWKPKPPGSRRCRWWELLNEGKGGWG